MYAVIWESKGIRTDEWTHCVAEYEKEADARKWFDLLNTPGFGPTEYRQIRLVKILDKGFCGKGESTHQ